MNKILIEKDFGPRTQKIKIIEEHGRQKININRNKIELKYKTINDNKNKDENDANFLTIQVKEEFLKSYSEKNMMNVLNEDNIQLLTKLRKKYLREKEITMKKLDELTTVYLERESEEKNKAKENKILCDHIRKIHYETNPKKALEFLFELKKLQLEERLKSNDKIIIQKDQELFQANIDKELIQKEVLYAKSLIKMINEGKEANYIAQLKSSLQIIVNKSNERKKKLQQLHKISLQHKTCPIIHRSLKHIIEQSSKEFENDKMFYGILPSLPIQRYKNPSCNDSMIINVNINDNPSILLNNKMKIIPYSKKGRNLEYSLSTQSIHSNKQSNENKSCLSMLLHKNSSEKILFNLQEKQRLSQLIPLEKLQIFEDRYQNADSLKSEMNVKLRLKSAKKKEIIKINMIKYNENSNKLIKQRKETINLRHDLLMCRSEIISFKERIHEVMQKLLNSQADFQKKNEDYNALFKHLQKMRREFSLEY